MERDDDTQHEQVLDGLYEASVNPEAWPRGLHELLRWVGADALMLVGGPAGQRRVLHASGHRDDYVRRYVATWLQRDPRLGGTPRGSAEGPRRDTETDAEACRGFEREHHIAGGFADLLATAPDENHWVLLSVRDAAAQARVVTRYGRVRRHLERALRLARRQAGVARRSRALADLVDDMPLGVMLLDADGRVQHSNLMARRMLDAEDSLRVRDGRLRALRDSDDERLRTALREAQVPDEDGALVTRWLPLPRRTGEPAYTVAVSVAADGDGAVAGGACCLRLVIGDAAHLPEVSAEALGRLYELTMREAQVCVRLLRGLSIEDTAGDLGVSPRTARVYLQQVFLKLAVHRQADLVRLLMGCPALLTFGAPEPDQAPPAEPHAPRRAVDGTRAAPGRDPHGPAPASAV